MISRLTLSPLVRPLRMLALPLFSLSCCFSLTLSMVVEVIRFSFGIIVSFTFLSFYKTFSLTVKDTMEYSQTTYHQQHKENDNN